MNTIEKYKTKAAFELGIITEKDISKEMIDELREIYIKEAKNYYNQYIKLKKKLNN